MLAPRRRRACVTSISPSVSSMWKPRVHFAVSLASLPGAAQRADRPRLERDHHAVGQRVRLRPIGRGPGRRPSGPGAEARRRGRAAKAADRASAVKREGSQAGRSGASRMAPPHPLTFEGRSSHEADRLGAAGPPRPRIASETESQRRRGGRVCRLASMPIAMSSARASSPTLGQRDRRVAQERGVHDARDGRRHPGCRVLQGRRLARGELEDEPHEGAHVGERRRARRARDRATSPG